MRIATQIKAERRTIFASVYNTVKYYTDKNECSKSDECIGNIEDVAPAVLSRICCALLREGGGRGGN